MFFLSLLEMIDSDEDKIKFEAFYHKYKDFIMYISLKRLGNQYSLAEENAQDVFIALAKNFDKIKDIDSKETKSYVYTVANGLAINKFHKEIRHTAMTIDYDNTVQISDETFDLYNVTELKNAIESLTDEEKTYFRLKYLHGLSLKEIGTIYKEDSSTVSRKLMKITKKLRERLGESNE